MESLPPRYCERRCQVCSSPQGLARCGGCRVVMYCGIEHQTKDRKAHKASCNRIKKNRARLEEEETRLRALPPSMFHPARIFEDHAGKFWGYHETRPYMTQRYALVESILEVHSAEAAREASDHLLDMLRLCRGDNMGVRSVVPALMLLLGRDQDCYDFIRWWATTGNNDEYDWGDMSLPYLDTKNADALEPVNRCTARFANLEHKVALTLLKVRLWMNVEILQEIPFADRAGVSMQSVGEEDQDGLMRHFKSDIPIQRREIMNCQDLSDMAQMLTDQIVELHAMVHDHNPHFWPALFRADPAELATRPGMYTHGDRSEMLLCLRNSYLSWAKTENALEFMADFHAFQTAGPSDAAG